MESRTDNFAAFALAVQSNDAPRAAELIEAHPELKSRIDEPAPELAFDTLPIVCAAQRGSREMIEVLLNAGADINGRSRWWAGGFGVLDVAPAALAEFLIERGARLDAHSAARLGMLQELRGLISADPSLVHARGGDGQTPLHFAATVEIAEYLLAQGAAIDALDIDHESTPAQYMPRDRTEVARFLVGRGARTDLLMAAALGDSDLARKHLELDPGAIRMIVSERWFPKRNPHSGGTIYIWTLGQYWTPHRAAREFSHPEVLHLLLEHSPADLKLAVACEFGDEAAVRGLLSSRPDLAHEIPQEDHRKIADAALNNNTAAVGLMLKAGWPVNARGQHGATPLHWAGWHGNLEMVREILPYAPALELKESAYQGTPLGWAIHGSANGWRRDEGDYVGVVEALIAAGAQAPAVTDALQASEAVRQVLLRRS